MTDEKKPDEKQPAAPAPETAPAAKKEKPPAIEAKPFAEFIQTHYIPGLQAGFEAQGIANIYLTFLKQKLPVTGYSTSPECWQVEGKWSAVGQVRQFNIYFYDEDIQGNRGFSVTDDGKVASTLESFRIDEKKVTLDLLVGGTLQRLNSQKWLSRN